MSKDEEGFFARMLHLKFARSVTSNQVADALGDRMKPHLLPEVMSLCRKVVHTSYYCPLPGVRRVQFARDEWYWQRDAEGPDSLVPVELPQEH